MNILMRSMAVIVACTVMGCDSGTGDSDQNTTQVKVQLNWFPESEFGGLYEASLSGEFLKSGLEVELLKGGPSVPAAQMVASGQVEFAVVSAPQLMTLRSQGGPVTAVFSTFQKNPRGIVVRMDSPYSSLEDLWKSSATVMGENGLEFMKWLNREYTGKDLAFVPYTGSLVPFIEKKVDAMQCFATAEPVQLEIDGVPNTVFIVADTGYNPYETVIAVNDDFLKDHPEQVDAFVVALRKGWNAYLDSPRKTNQHMHSLNPDMTMNVLEISCSLLANYVQSDVTARKDIGWMTQERWDQLGKQLTLIDILTEDSVKKIGTPFINPPLVTGE